MLVMTIITVMCRLVEEVREACEVDITNDDVFMNSRCDYVVSLSCVCVCICVCVTMLCHYVCVEYMSLCCVIVYIIMLTKEYYCRFEDFVQMVVSNSRGGGGIDFEYDAVSCSVSQ